MTCAFYAADISINSLPIDGKGKTLFVYFDGLTVEEEKTFMIMCTERNIVVCKCFTVGMNARKWAILSTGGYLDQNTARPFKYVN